ncbi:hypothetical protein E4N62_45495 [Streptomyces sp. MNU76]|uniref:hypothetical protein n=1 Tax=Streptomyces sp. MNU76 TaxID=2560026 RepID=UPI001E36EAD2|nr:hypothetical protein [Streptomyces sp. MNU76]MCC9711838.1 hypothetical protein [Streptomyces sp. MNU76]
MTSKDLPHRSGPSDQFGPMVLRVGLDLAPREPDVYTELVTYTRGREPRSLWHGHFGPQDFGLPEGTGLSRELRVPDSLASAVSETLGTFPFDWSALWLRLVPPYGQLGAVPWEEKLIRRIGRTLLRVPDQLPAPADSGPWQSMAIVVNAGPHASWAAEWIRSFGARFARQRPYIVQHFFPDLPTFEALAPSPEEAEVPGVVHDPRRAASIHQERAA